MWCFAMSICLWTVPHLQLFAEQQLLTTTPRHLTATPLSWSSFWVRNPSQSSFDKTQERLQDRGRKQGTIFVEHSHCPWTGDGWVPGGEGGGWQREEEWCTVRTLHSMHTPSLYPPSYSSDHSVGPLSPFSLLNSVTLWNMCKGRSKGWGWGGFLLCNTAFPNRSSSLLKM